MLTIGLKKMVAPSHASPPENDRLALFYFTTNLGKRSTKCREMLGRKPDPHCLPAVPPQQGFSFRGSILNGIYLEGMGYAHACQKELGSAR